MSSHPKLTSLTTTTLSLLLERQRLQSTHPTLHLTQIVANLRTLRSGVISLQDASDAGSGDDGTEALREQYERLRGMLGEEEAEKAGLTRYAFPPFTRPQGRSTSGRLVVLLPMSVNRSRQSLQHRATRSTFPDAACNPGAQTQPRSCL